MIANIVEETKQHFFDTVDKAGLEYSYLLRHLPQVEKWAKKLIERKPEANKEVVLLGVWLHDIGQVVGNKETDHAINSEVEARRFLAELGVGTDLNNQVAHCARAHRCKDVQPETIEAKFLAVADSASHMTDIVYNKIQRRPRVYPWMNPKINFTRSVKAFQSTTALAVGIYVDMANRGNLEDAKAKLARDYRDVSLFPEIKEEISSLYQAWKRLFEVWPVS